MPLIKQSDEYVIKDGMREGKGTARLFHATASLAEGPIGLASRIELEPGASIGFHLHDCDEEVYAIVSGRGVYEFDGGECQASQGDIFTTKKGMSHGLRNTG
ncbi:MAG: cupin domain-containing protein, partial [Synergistaceae bacterium]|nr:cupin domain-containing protein [Synergistaceae bacterium]